MGAQRSGSAKKQECKKEAGAQKSGSAKKREPKEAGAQRNKNVKNWKGKEAGVLKCLKTFGKKKKKKQIRSE